MSATLEMKRQAMSDITSEQEDIPAERPAGPQRVVSFEFTSGVDEVFDISLVAGSRLTAMQGPFADEDGEKTIWNVPSP